MKPYPTRSPDPIHLPGQADTPASVDDTPLTWGECAWACSILAAAAAVLIALGSLIANLILS